MNVYYEVHHHPDPQFPLIFHDAKTKSNEKVSGIHWHEALEILLVKEGEIQVISDAERICAHVGEAVVINSNAVHVVDALSDEAEYYCLIIDCSFAEEASFNPEHVLFNKHITDGKIKDIYNSIVDEIENKRELYQATVKALIAQLCVELWRNYRALDYENRGQDNHKIVAVKKVIRYLASNCGEKISVDKVVECAGYSKYHFSRVFKEYTGMSIIEFLNFERCNRAEKLIADGMSVGSAALVCGFENMSYFTRTFRKYKGRLPSDKKRAAG